MAAVKTAGTRPVGGAAQALEMKIESSRKLEVAIAKFFRDDFATAYKNILLA